MQPKPQWERVSSEKGPDLKLFQARFDHMKNPRNGITERMIILESPDSVNVVAETSNGDIVFVKQYRFGIEAETLELPGGLLDENEMVSLAAKRELEEETGYVGQQWKELGRIPSNPVFMDSYIHHWLVKDAAPNGEVTLDDGEAVDVVLLSKEEAKKRLYAGAFQHPHTVNALLIYFAQH